MEEQSEHFIPQYIAIANYSAKICQDTINLLNIFACRHLIHSKQMMNPPQGDPNSLLNYVMTTNEVVKLPSDTRNKTQLILGKNSLQTQSIWPVFHFNFSTGVYPVSWNIAHKFGIT